MHLDSNGFSSLSLTLDRSWSWVSPTRALPWNFGDKQVCSAREEFLPIRIRRAVLAIGEVTKRQRDSIQSKRKVVKMLIAVVLIFGICWYDCTTIGEVCAALCCLSGSHSNSISFSSRCIQQYLNGMEHRTCISSRISSPWAIRCTIRFSTAAWITGKDRLSLLFLFFSRSFAFV